MLVAFKFVSPLTRIEILKSIPRMFVWKRAKFSHIMRYNILILTFKNSYDSSKFMYMFY